MDRTERFYRIDKLLRSHRIVPLERFLDDLSVSRATFKRDLEYMRDRLNAPIEWDREAGGYRLRPDAQAAYQLPGLWFNDSEILALLTMEKLLEDISFEAPAHAGESFVIDAAFVVERIGEVAVDDDLSNFIL